MKTLILAVAIAATVSTGSQALAATAGPTDETGQDQAAIGGEVETGQQTETAAPGGTQGFESEGTDERSGGTGSDVTGLKGESLADEETMAQERSVAEPRAPFSAIDADGDGQLSLEEVRRAFEQADRDGSGTVDFGEYRDAMPNIGIGASQMEAPRDDASVEAERGAQEPAGQSSGQAVRAQEQGDDEFQPGEPVKLSDVDQPGREESATDAPFALADENRDGQLSPEEVVAAFRQADQDGDRHLSAQEWQQAMPRTGSSTFGPGDMSSESGAEDTAERGAQEGQDSSTREQWTGSPDPQRAREGKVQSWQDYQEMHERSIVRQPEEQPGGQAQGQTAGQQQ